MSAPAVGRLARGASLALRRAARALPLVVLAALGFLLAAAAWRARLEAPAPTLLVRDRHGRYLTEIADPAGREVGYWTLETLPPRVVAATLALEDRRFALHPGVDPLAVLRAFWQDLRTGRRVSGASTLAMQVARMQRPGPRSLLRKAVEALTAVLLTSRYGREAVLAHYLRLAPYGNRIHGIAYAARRYLDKPVDDLSWAEIAFLSALPQAPGRMNPFDPSGRVRAVARGERVLAGLREQAVVSAAEYELAREQIGQLRIPTREARPGAAMHAILDLERRMADPSARARLARAPLLNSTLDLDLQERVQGLVWETVAAAEDRGAGNAAVMVVDAASREVLASVGSAGFFDGARAGAIDYSTLPRSPGSTLKPFLYALALDREVITPTTVLDDLRRAPGGIANADHDYLGPLLPRVALANSRNVPAANLLARIGIDAGYAFLGELGLHDGVLPARRFGLGLAIGGMPVTLRRLVRAYGALAGEGIDADLVWLRGEAGGPARRVLSATAAREVTLFLADPEARLPSFPRMGATEYPFPVAVKTGTSPEVRDAWTVAYSRRALVGVWVGRPDYRPMSGLTGYAGAATLARRVMALLHRDEQDGLGDLSFPPPDGFRPVRVCALTGKRASPLCDRVFTEWLRPGQESPDECGAHAHVAVDRRDGTAATRRTPARYVDVRTVTVLAPRYAAWAAAHGVALPPVERAGAGVRSPTSAARSLRARLADRPARVRVTSPEPGARLLVDPDTPAALATVALEAVVEPVVPQVVWVVDGVPFAVADYPYTTRWPLRPGEHTFQARAPWAGADSRVVRVTVR